MLTGLPDLLVDEPALASVMGARHATLAVPEPARAIVLAAVARQTGRNPLVVAVPTGSEAEFLAADLRLYLGTENVELFPAWETLPFEGSAPVSRQWGVACTSSTGCRASQIGHRSLWHRAGHLYSAWGPEPETSHLS